MKQNTGLLCRLLKIWLFWFFLSKKATSQIFEYQIEVVAPENVGELGILGTTRQPFWSLNSIRLEQLCQVVGNVQMWHQFQRTLHKILSFKVAIKLQLINVFWNLRSDLQTSGMAWSLARPTSQRGESASFHWRTAEGWWNGHWIASRNESRSQSIRNQYWHYPEDPARKINYQQSSPHVKLLPIGQSNSLHSNLSLRKWTVLQFQRECATAIRLFFRLSLDFCINFCDGGTFDENGNPATEKFVKVYFHKRNFPQQFS